MALKKPSDFFGIEKVSTLSEQVEQISQDHCSDLEENISLSFSNIDGVFKNIQEQLLTSGKNQIVEVKEDLVELYKVVGDLIENEIPKYKKQVNTSELRVETRISNLKKELCEHFEDQVKDTKEKIEELYKEVITEEVFNARSFVKSLYNSEIQIAVEKYVSTYSNDIVSLREEIFKEIKKKPNGLVAIENKLQDLAYKYKVLSENLNDKNTNDPLLQSPVTFEQLKNHYQLLVGRLQEQLASVGGGGEVRLKYLDDIVGIATNASAYNGKFLKYNHSLEKFEFVSITDQTGIDLTDLSVSVSSPGISDLSYDNTTGVFTYTPQSLVGYATEGYVDNAVVGLASEGYVDNAVVGFITSGSLVGYATEGYVDNAVVGLASEGYVDNLVAISTFSGNYNDLSNKPLIPSIVGLASEGYVDNAIFGISTEKYWKSTAAGIHTLSNVGIGTTNPTSALTVIGSISATGNISLNSGSAERSIGFNNGSSNVYFYQLPTNDRNGHTGMFDGTNNRYIWRYYPIFDSFIFDRIVSITDTPSSTSLTGTPSQKLQVTGGTYISGNTGIGTTNPTSKLTVDGNVRVTGVVTATTFVGNFSGSITNATNLTGGTANASSLNVSGVTTISQGRIQADAVANLRFGNLPAGSGSGRNIAIGDQVLVSLSGGSGRNIGIGELSYYDTTTGQYNIGVGGRAGQKVSTGSYNVILGAYDGNSGNLDIRTSSNNVVIADGEGNIRQYINSSGNVGIKTTVVTEALTVVGVVSATSFYGTLNADQLTGVLPAIDGSALFGVVSIGAGVEIREDGTIVGTAATINFGSNINVSFGSGIATVSGASSVSEASTAYGLAGTPNVSLGNVTAGIATFNNVQIGLSTSLIVSSGNIQLGTNASGLLIKQNEINLTGPSATDLNSTYFSNIKLNKVGGGFKYDLEFHSNGYSSGDIGDFIFYRRQSGFSRQERFRISGETGSISATGNANISGIITASSFSGSASGLTNIPAGQLTGNLPAIDGSALLNVNATGSGIVVLDDNVNVGSARTINFGTGLDVSYSTSGIATITASGGSLQSRTTVSGTTASLANNGIGNTNITGFKSYALMKVGLSTAGWLRIYTDSASRVADASRSIGIDPLPGSGVIAEVVTTGISTTQIISPFVMGGNLDDPADTTIYAAITNLSGSTQSITANLTILQLEA